MKTKAEKKQSPEPVVLPKKVLVIAAGAIIIFSLLFVLFILSVLNPTVSLSTVAEKFASVDDAVERSSFVVNKFETIKQVNLSDYSPGEIIILMYPDAEPDFSEDDGVKSSIHETGHEKAIVLRFEDEASAVNYYFVFQSFLQEKGFSLYERLGYDDLSIYLVDEDALIGGHVYILQRDSFIIMLTNDLGPGVSAGELSDGKNFLGNLDAKVKVVEFADFQCQFSARFHAESFSRLNAGYIDTGKILFVFRHFPSPYHNQADNAAEAAECAADQGKFWEMHNRLFEQSSSLNNSAYILFAMDLGLDLDRFNDCMSNREKKATVMDDFSTAAYHGVSGTPVFFVNGEFFAGYDKLDEIISKIEEDLGESSTLGFI